MPADANALLTIPAWGVFAFLVIKAVLDFLAKQSEKRRVADLPPRDPSKPPTPEEIAAVLRDQQERQELLEHMRASESLMSRLAEAIERTSEANERVAQSQDKLLALIERQAQRTRALAESTAASRDALVRMQGQLEVVQDELRDLRRIADRVPRAETNPGT
jgi:ABC-type transporter Mla subunit MlaD